MFDPRLKAVILKIVDVSYGGENGFNQAIELSTEVLASVKFIQEKKLISKFFEEISQDSGKYCYGVKDTLAALEIGAVETLVVWESLDYNRYKIKHPSTGGTKPIDQTHKKKKITTNCQLGFGLPLRQEVANNHTFFWTHFLNRLFEPIFLTDFLNLFFEAIFLTHFLNQFSEVIFLTDFLKWFS